MTPICHSSVLPRILPFPTLHPFLMVPHLILWVLLLLQPSFLPLPIDCFIMTLTWCSSFSPPHSVVLSLLYCSQYLYCSSFIFSYLFPPTFWTSTLSPPTFFLDDLFSFLRCVDGLHFSLFTLVTILCYSAVWPLTFNTFWFNRYSILPFLPQYFTIALYDLWFLSTIICVNH